MPANPTPHLDAVTAKSVRVSPCEGFVSVCFSDGLAADFHPLHLLHSSSSNEGAAREKIRTIAELPGDAKVSACEISSDLSRLLVTYENRETAEVSVSLLHRYAVAWSAPRTHRAYLDSATPVPRVDFDSLESDDGLLSLLSAIDKWGLVVVHGLPPEDPNCVSRIAHRITGHPSSPAHLYGETFDVRTSAPGQASNVAYTSEPLKLHCDLVSSCSTASNSIRTASLEGPFIDAFAAAEELRQRNPEAFKTLCAIPASFKKIRSGVKAETFDATMTFHAPHVTLDPRTEEVINVRWSPQFEDLPVCR
uniref:TauD/TfdA-like domain-containing protein n=1 Tax=Chromera velia CCMP2878 TaxID=1169474 RepID=A0A0G4H8C1_9ALVE|eukprot:Cvel_25106.t1-p1 / transcript=Cvel_25106.t1 / gene=Cvel_25106 / organism=Chromera_velia_CCMP2878 / gene_product=Gamma-butyrobetaine dioxygenase, putative / transcript_product=Gamma-butyrobetaine dioxygenase, putative / location=Cvel_scaffold2801:8891-10776(+) / protein_length=306 / sequence_SO=supercontig / SO=protein_coding / is_pseudo=false